MTSPLSQVNSQFLESSSSSAMRIDSHAIRMCRRGYRPALRHTLWALVLLKLITPPLVPVPVLPSHPVESSVISSHGLQELPSGSALQPLEDTRQSEVGGRLCGAIKSCRPGNKGGMLGP